MMKLNFYLRLVNVPLVNVRLVTVGFFVAFGLAGWACTQNPDFELKKQTNEPLTILENATVDEIQTHLASFKGEKPVLVNIWATWCLPCVEEFPYIMDLKQQYGEAFELVFISADFEEARAEATDFLKEQGVDFTTFFKQGKDNDFITGISEKWSGAIPYTLIIDKDGVTHTEWEGKADYQDFEHALLEVIK